MDKMLKIEDIEKSISSYVFDKRKKQAVLLDGEWGCGKTFFVNNILIPRLEKHDNTRVFKISLYGISSIDIIQEMIYGKWLELYISKFSDKLGIIGQLVNKGIDIFGKPVIRLVEDKLSTEGLFENLANTAMENDINRVEYNIIIFDDLERCSIDILQLMGFLNNLSENNGFRLILIANEKEIKCKNNSIEEALKYLFILKNQEHFLDYENNATKNRELSKKDLKAYSVNIFNEESLYGRTREKLIGLSIQYSISISEIFESVIQEYIEDEGLIIKLIDNKDNIIKLFAENGHQNIRTFISACIIISDIFYTIDKNNFTNKDILDNELNSVILYAIYSTIRRAKGNAPFEWLGNTRYSYINNNSVDIGTNVIFGYAFVDEYWNTQCVDKAIATEDITNIICHRKEVEESKRQEEERKNLSLYKLIKWYLLEDDEVQRLIGKMKDELHNKKYKPFEFKDIICTLININNSNFGMFNEENVQENRIILYESIGITQFEGLEYIDEECICNKYSEWEKVDIKDFVQNMLSYFDDSSCTLTKEMLNIVSSDKQFIYNYSMTIMPLIEMIEKNKFKEIANVSNGVDISDIPWDDSLELLLKKKREEYVKQGRFLSLFDYKKLIEHILLANQYEIHCFCDGLKSIYKCSNIAKAYAYDREIVNKVSILIEENFEKIVNQRKSRTNEIALRRLREMFREYRKSFVYEEEKA